MFGLASGATELWMNADAIALKLLFVIISVPMMLTRKRESCSIYDELVDGVPALFPRSF